MCLISVRLSVTTSKQQRNAGDGIRRSSYLGMESIEGPQWACILIPRLQHTLNFLKPSPYTLHTSTRHYLLHLTILRSTRSTQPTITLRPQHSTNLAETFAVPNHPPATHIPITMGGLSRRPNVHHPSAERLGPHHQRHPIHHLPQRPPNVSRLHRKPHQFQSQSHYLDPRTRTPPPPHPTIITHRAKAHHHHQLGFRKPRPQHSTATIPRAL